MSSVTPNIGLILPDGSENVSRQVINENYTKIDTAFANVGNSTMREVPFNIPTSAWTLSDGVYTAEFTTVYVTASSKEIGTYTSSLRQYAKADIDMAKKSGGGGMVFTTTTAPTGTISGSLYIWDNDDGKVPIVVEGTVIPISNGGTGANDLSTAKSNLGITAVENQTSANTQAIASITGHGSNANGEYWKFPDGTLICAKSVTPTVTFSEWGSLYESSVIQYGSWAYAFKSGTIPFVTAMLKNSGAAAIVVSIGSVTNESAGTGRVTRPNNPGEIALGIDVIGIGRWK